MPAAGLPARYLVGGSAVLPRIADVCPASLAVHEQVADAAQHRPVERVRPVTDAGMLAGSTRIWTDGARNAEDHPRARTA